MCDKTWLVNCSRANQRGKSFPLEFNIGWQSLCYVRLGGWGSRGQRQVHHLLCFTCSATRTNVYPNICPHADKFTLDKLDPDMSRCAKQFTCNFKDILFSYVSSSKNLKFTDLLTQWHLAHLEIYQIVWVCMTMHDFIRLCMTMYDHVWPCMTMYDYVWICMNMYDYVWLCMTMYDYVWLCMTMFD